MSIRYLFSRLLILAVSFAPCACAIAQGEWTIETTFHVGGEGGFDYITVDAKSRRLYVPRSTHTMVIDAATGKLIADIAGQKHNHGVALAPDLGRGFISDGSGSIVIFDLKTNEVLGTVASKDDTDGIIYDKSTGLILVACGDAGVLVTLKADADPRTATVDAIDLGGKPEYLASDGSGKAYVNLEDKNQVAVVDLNVKKVLAHWPVAPGGAPVGMSIDTTKQRIFVGCRNPQKLIVMSTNDGKIIAELPIAAGVDATRWDGQQVFASTREGKLTVAEDKGGGKFETVQTVTTGFGTKTMDIDNAVHKIYLPTAEFEEAKPGTRPAAKPGTFMIVVVTRH